jgi:hypothetical protein
MRLRGIIPVAVPSSPWERTRLDDEIIDNDFVSHAQAMAVTISPSDSSVASRACGPWRRSNESLGAAPQRSGVEAERMTRIAYLRQLRTN